jgi:hypothetical protein
MSNKKGDFMSFVWNSTSFIRIINFKLITVHCNKEIHKYA